MRGMCGYGMCGCTHTHTHACMHAYYIQPIYSLYAAYMQPICSLYTAYIHTAYRLCIGPVGQSWPRGTGSVVHGAQGQ